MRLVVLALLALGPGPPPESEIVRSLNVEAPAPERFLRYIDQKVGAPYDPAAVRRAVELLYATGEFEDVEVGTHSRPDGLDVVFLPKPAPRLREIQVEGDRVLSPGALRRLARLRRGEPLWQDRLNKAATEAGLALAKDGYLESQVTAAAVPAADPFAGANALFHVRAGPRARVGRAVIEPVGGPVPGTLQDLMRPRPGQIYRKEEADKAKEAMRKQLVEIGRWRATVEVDAPYDPATARVSLTFRVTPGAWTTLEVRGGRVSSGLRGHLQDLIRDGQVKDDVLDQATEQLEEHFRHQGHRDVAVRHHEEPRPPLGQAVVFEIQPGPLYAVASVRVEGAPFPPPLLATRAGEPLQDRALDEDVRGLARMLEEDGYPGARVELDAPEGGGPTRVLFRVRPGPKTAVREVVIEATPALAAGESWGVLRLRKGAPYRVRELAGARNAILTAYRNAGYLAVEVTPEVVFSADRTEVTVTLRVSPGVRTDVGHVVIAGLEKTREEVVRRELLLKEGQPLGLQKVLESQRRLGTLAIFERADIQELDPEGGSPRSVVVLAREAPPTTITYGVGYAEQDRLRGSVEVSRRNLFGLDRTLSAYARASFLGNRFLLSYREPHFLAYKQDLFVTGYREQEDRTSFSYTRFGGQAQTARILTRRLNLILRLSFQQTRVYNVQVPIEAIDRQFRSYTASGPSATILNDTRDDPLDPHRGAFLGADVQLSTNVLGGASFLKGFFQAAGYRRLGSRLVFALSGRLGLARTLGQGQPLLLPLPERFFAGGDSSLRGFDVDFAGPLAPASDGTLHPTGGNALLLGNAEVRLDTTHSLSVAAFSDVGNVYSLISDVDLGELRYTAGLGLRYKTSFGPLRVDWGYKLNRLPGEGPYHFHVTVGHAF
jgi:outer membrane protein insertion porin family